MDHGSDWRGDDQPPEELNRIQAGEDYGWPFCFGRGRIDRFQPMDPALTSKRAFCGRSARPALTYTAHAAPIGFAFYRGSAFPGAYRNDAFAAMRGSWNRSEPSGYEVVRVRFDDHGRPEAITPFLTGFLRRDGRVQYGRVAGVVEAADGALLVSEDTNGIVYRITHAG